MLEVDPCCFTTGAHQAGHKKQGNPHANPAFLQEFSRLSNFSQSPTNRNAPLETFCFR
jgi:hypothetical protein